MNRQEKPLTILIFLWTIAIGLGMLSFAFPEKGISIFNIFSFKYPSYKALFLNEKPQYAAIPAIVAVADKSSLEVIKEDELKEKTTSIEAAKGIKLEDKTPIKKTEIQSKKIDFANDDATVLYRFFSKLEGASTADKPVRIIHYGDSQIEGDRISGFIRERLQNRFGGGGPGLQPASQFYKQANVSQSNSGNWFRYTLFGEVNKNVKHNKYGAMCVFSKFTDVSNDTSIENQVSESIINFNSATSIYPSAKKFQQVKVFYGNAKSEINIEVNNNSNNIAKEIIEPEAFYNVKTFNFETAVNQAELIFRGKDSPDIYGISLDMPYGVAVDNIAMRGGSGTIFNKMDRKLLSNMLHDLNTELIIMQFGGNVMPYIKDEKACTDYGNWFYSQLATIKAAKPGVAIIVIGPADMSMKVNDYYETYTYLENVRDALKQAAFKAGAGFWDMYNAMGGKNSMPSWVVANPPLASTDYVHFSPKGARIIAELFYDALNHEFENYRYSKTIKEE